MKYELPPLSHAGSALAPYIDARTRALRHGRDKAAYVTGLNAALKALPFATREGAFRSGL